MSTNAGNETPTLLAMVGRLTGAASRLLIVVGLLALLGNAAAQFEVNGIIEGTVDGEARTWYTLAFDSDQGPDGTAWLRDYGNEYFTMVLLDIQAHDEPRYKTEGTLTLGGSLTQDLADCPCTLGEPDIMYFASGSMFSNVYVTIEAELVVESATAADDGTVLLTGTFTGLLGFVADALQGSDPDRERAITVAGTFTLDRVRWGE